MRKSFLMVLLLGFCSFLAAQQAMNNDSVVKMVKAGLSDEIIVSTINSSPGTYDTSADALIALKTAGVSDKVISAIVAKLSGAPAAPAVVQTQQNTPAPAVQEPEVMSKIYFLDPGSHALKLLPGEQWKRKNKGGFGSVKAVDIVSGQHSSFRISSKDKIVFVFRPLPDQQNANILQGIRIYPFEVKSNERDCIVDTQKTGFRGPTRQGNLDVVSLQVVKYGTSSYALNPPDFHLDPGEYWIHVPGAAGYSDPLITLGVD